MVTDRHEGWHVFLNGIYRATGCGKENLVVFSVVFLALLFLLTPLSSLSRPEIWPLIVALVGSSLTAVCGEVILRSTIHPHHGRATDHLL